MAIYKTETVTALNLRFPVLPSYGAITLSDYSLRVEESGRFYLYDSGVLTWSKLDPVPTPTPPATTPAAADGYINIYGLSFGNDTRAVCTLRHNTSGIIYYDVGTIILDAYTPATVLTSRYIKE